MSNSSQTRDEILEYLLATPLPTNFLVTYIELKNFFPFEVFEDNECTDCFGKLENNNTFIVFPCGHYMHNGCETHMKTELSLDDKKLEEKKCHYDCPHEYQEINNKQINHWTKNIIKHIK